MRARWKHFLALLLLVGIAVFALGPVGRGPWAKPDDIERIVFLHGDAFWGGFGVWIDGSGVVHHQELRNNKQFVRRYTLTPAQLAALRTTVAHNDVRHSRPWARSTATDQAHEALYIYLRDGAVLTVGGSDDPRYERVALAIRRLQAEGEVTFVHERPHDWDWRPPGFPARPRGSEL